MEKILCMSEMSSTQIILQNSISALILTNTTNSNREKLKNYQKNELGGLSGKPIEEISNHLNQKLD